MLHPISLCVCRVELSRISGCWVETDGEDFSPKKLAYGILETDVGEFVDTVYYDKKELIIDGGGDSQSKHCVAQVGVIPSRWIKDSKANALKKINWDKYD